MTSGFVVFAWRVFLVMIVTLRWKAQAFLLPISQRLPSRRSIHCRFLSALHKNQNDKTTNSVSGTIYHDDTSTISVTLFTKSGCTLCDKVTAVLQELRPTHPHTLLAVDITDANQKECFEKYKYDIPVLHLNKQYWTKHRLTQEQAVEGFQAMENGTFTSPVGEPNAAKYEK